MSRATYAEHLPAPQLRARIECYWTLAGDDVGAQRVLPDGCMDMLFDLASEAPTLVGTMTTALVVPATARARYVGVRFRPGEAFAMVGLPAGSVTDRAVPLDDALGALAGSLADEIASARDDGARVAVLDRRLASLHERARAADPRVRRVVARIFDAPAEARVARRAREVGASERHLERMFGERVGVGPKQLARVARLRALLARADRAPGASWSALAQGAGYADQAHMIREVRRLSGLTPAVLARSRAGSPAVSDSFNPAPASRATTGA